MQSHEVFENHSFNIWKNSSFQQSVLCPSALNPVCCVSFRCPCRLTPLLHPALCTRGITSKDSLSSAFELNPVKWETQQQTGGREEGEGWSIYSLASLPEELPVWNPNWRSQVFLMVTVIKLFSYSRCWQPLLSGPRCVSSPKALQYSFWFLSASSSPLCTS